MRRSEIQRSRISDPDREIRLRWHLVSGVPASCAAVYETMAVRCAYSQFPPVRLRGPVQMALGRIRLRTLFQAGTGSTEASNRAAECAIDWHAKMNCSDSSNDLVCASAMIPAIYMSSMPSVTRVARGENRAAGIDDSVAVRRGGESEGALQIEFSSRLLAVFGIRHSRTC